MSALFLALTLGLAVLWTKATLVERLLNELQDIVLAMVNRILIPVLPFFIAANFCILSYEGALSNQLPVFLKVIGVILAGHFIWLAFFIWSSRSVCRKESLESVKALYTCLFYSRRDDVFCCDVGSGFEIRESK